MTDPHRLVRPAPDLPWPDGPADGDRRRRAAAYHAWVREHHPDRGGDPAVFVHGLLEWQRTLRRPAAGRDTTDGDGGAVSGGGAGSGGAGDRSTAAATGPLSFHRTRRRSPLAWWAARRAERARPARVR